MMLNTSRLALYYIIFVSIGKETIRVLCDSASSTSIPRSNHHSESYTKYSYPPWNPSSNIDVNGFLLKQYKRIPGEWEKEFKIRHKHPLQPACVIRQVPGDGNCLFHSISTCYAHAVNGTHIDLKSPENLQWLYENSARLRQQAVDCLSQKRKLLFLQGHEYLKARDLVEAAASQYGISGSEYCSLMRKPSYWGGGPEIVALCNVLQRPIHVYELYSKDNRFLLRRMACFGSPKYKKKPLHILSADSRFPDLAPGKQLESGNHFLAMFPEEKKRKQKRIRGGGDDGASPPGVEVQLLNDDEEAKEGEDDDKNDSIKSSSWLSRVFNRYRNNSRFR